MTLSLAMNILMIVLLILTIFYAFLLNRRLRVLHSSKEELMVVMDRFSKATASAHAAINDLKKSAIEIDQNLQTVQAKASRLYTDLKFIVQKGEEVADKLERDINDPAARLPKVDERQGSLLKDVGDTIKDPKAAILKAIRDMR